MSRLRTLLCAALCPLLPMVGAAQQSTVATPAVRLQGLRSVNAHGSFKAAAHLPDGSVLLLYDQGDGLRLLKTDAAASTILAQARQGASGDTGVALTLDQAGNIYVAGTSSSGQLAGTSGTAFPSPVDASLNSFVARFDSNLNLTFLTFLGASRTEVTAIAASTDAVFVTGATYGGTIPTTAGALQRTPPNPSIGTGNGFVERFTTDGASLTYATYLSGLDGGTVPSSVAAGANDAVYVAGETSASTFPTTNALQPAIFGPVNGFLSQLAPDGTSLQFSTFLAGSGISSLALDPASNTLLLTGNIAPGQFPIATVAAPIAQTPYQTLVRLSSDGQSLVDSVLLLPGSQSFVTPGPGGTAWITGSLAAPLSPSTINRGPGDSFVLHLTAADNIDQLLRIGGSATNNPSYAHLTTTVAAPALSSDGQTLLLPGTVSALTDPSLRATQAFDLGLNAASSSLLPGTSQDLLPAACPEGQACAGSGALLTLLALGTTQPSLTLSTGDLPNLTLHNPSGTSATGVAVLVNGTASSTTCASTLAPFAQCTTVFTGSGAGTLSVTSTNAPSLSDSFTAPAAVSSPLAFDTSELDFGIVTASGSPVTRTVTVTNLSSTLQTFASAADVLPSAAPYTLFEAASTCPGVASAHTLAAQASCTVQVGVTGSSTAQDDGLIAASWKLGSRDIAITGFAQAAPLAVSASEIDFGPQPTGSAARLPRFLYLSNSSANAVPHVPLSLPPESPFTLVDGCPSTLAPGSVCQITLTYNQANAPSLDTTTLTLDQGLTVLVTGETLVSSVAPAVTSPSPLLVSPASVSFVNPVTVSQLSAEIQTVQVSNAGNASVPLAASVTGDFTVESSCGATLAPDQTCSLALSFAPTQPGVREGVLTITAAPGDEPITVPVTGTATALLLADNGTVDLGQTVVQEPITTWLQLQGSFPQISASVTDGSAFTVALLADDGNGHGTLPSSAFTSATSAPCAGCWLAVRFLPQAAGPATGVLQLSSGNGGQPYQLNVQATAIPAQGLVLTPETQSFGAVPEGTSSAPFTVTLTNLLPGATAAAIQQVSVAGDFATAPNTSPLACAGTLQPTASCILQLIFTPSANGQRTGTLTVTTTSGNAAATLAGVGIDPTASAATTQASTGVSISPSQADFGPQPTSTVSTARQFVLLNFSSETQTISFAASRNFPLAQAPVCDTLAPNASCSFTVVFAPDEAGPLTGSVSITATPQGSSASTQTVLYLRGYATASDALSASGGLTPGVPLTFGTVSSGTSSTQTLTITNSGTTAHTIRRLTTTTPFQLTNTCTQALAPGASCNLAITYSAANQLPSTASQTPRTDTGTLLIESDTQDSPITVYLTGTVLPSSSGTGLPSSALPTFTLSQSALTFPDTPPAGSSPSQTITVSNSGAVPVTFDGLLTPADFQATTNCTVLQPGATCNITASFNPPQVSTTASVGALGIISNAANALDFISLLASSFPAQLQFNPTSLDFGPVPLRSPAQRTATLTNITDLPATLTTPLASGDFSVDTSACPAIGSSIAAGQSCVLTITFTPLAPGVRTGSVTLPGAAAGATSPTIALTGTGMAGQLQSSPAALIFGTVTLTSSANQTLTLTNTGQTTLSGLALSLIGTNPADFSLTSTCPSSLPAGSACTVQVLFTPSAQGQRSATLSISSTDPSSPTLVTLTGVGSQAPGFTLLIDGSTADATTISSGATATLPLTLTPQGGYTGAVALTCAPIAAAPNATCTLANPQLTLASGAVSSSVSLITVSGTSSSLVWPLGLLALVPAAARSDRRKRRRRFPLLILALSLIAAASVTGCGSGPGNTAHPYTPPGTYQYQVTARSTSGPSVSSTVTLSVTVQ